MRGAETRVEPMNSRRSNLANITQLFTWSHCGLTERGLRSRGPPFSFTLFSGHWDSKNQCESSDRENERSCWHKKNKGKKEEKNRNSQAHSGGCSSEEKNRNSKLASETFKERSKEKFWTTKCQLWSTLRGGGAANAFLSWAPSFYINTLYLLYWPVLSPKQETHWLGKYIPDIIVG